MQGTVGLLESQNPNKNGLWIVGSNNEWMY